MYIYVYTENLSLSTLVFHKQIHRLSLILSLPSLGVLATVIPLKLENSRVYT